MKVIDEIRRELETRVDEKYRQGATRFFKEEVRPYGVRTGEVRKIAAKYWKEIKNKRKEEIWQVCEKLWQSGWFEEGGIAIVWADKMEDRYEEKDFEMFERWLKNYAKNWAHVDVFCTSSVGKMLAKHPKFLKRLDRWSQSPNRWLRRAAAVSLIYPVKRKLYLKKAWQIADKVLLDQDDLVQKGYGWMLKVASDVCPQEVFDFVMKRKNKMPRTALRYAIEKMPLGWKREAMKK